VGVGVLAGSLGVALPDCSPVGVADGVPLSVGGGVDTEGGLDEVSASR
jgi:hypothetical protein